MLFQNFTKILAQRIRCASLQARHCSFQAVPQTVGWRAHSVNYDAGWPAFGKDAKSHGFRSRNLLSEEEIHREKVQGSLSPPPTGTLPTCQGDCCCLSWPLRCPPVPYSASQVPLQLISYTEVLVFFCMLRFLKIGPHPLARTSTFWLHPP